MIDQFYCTQNKTFSNRVILPSARLAFPSVWLIVLVTVTLTAVTLTGCSTKQLPKPLTYPKKAYTLTYALWQGKNEQGIEATPRQCVMSSDGHGYVAFADETAHVVRLDDFLQGKSYSFNNEKRMANWTTLKNNEPWELDVDLFYLSPAAKTKIPIGDRDIKGLHCEGWKVRDEIYWFDKQFGYLMYAEQRADNHHPYHWLMQTSKYSDLAMPDDTFKVPPGYEVRNLEEKRITLY